ncbi:MAG: hypothetical protein IPI67_41675 [Myxococcales bacterium]|nr:hypothetical protein [Myxococcales bacterium]
MQRGSITRLVARVALVAALGACSGTRFVPYTPLEKKTDIEAKKLYDAAEGTLLDRGYLIEKRDPAGLTLVTEPRTLLGSEIGQNKFRYVWKVQTNGGTLSINLSCQEAGGLGDPSKCDKDAPEKIVQEQAGIAEQVLKEAKGE